MNKELLKTGDRLIIKLIPFYYPIRDEIEIEVIYNSKHYQAVLLLGPKNAALYKWDQGFDYNQNRYLALKKYNYSNYFQYQYGSFFVSYEMFSIEKNL